MRVTGYLFTFIEMAAAIADDTFTAGDTTVVPSTQIATVIDALNSLDIYPLSGPNNRCPSWDELHAKPTGGGGAPGLTVVLTSDGHTLTATVFGGTSPYNYSFDCIPEGPCYYFNIANESQLNQSSTTATTAYTFTPYSGTTYEFHCFVTDDLGNTSLSNTLFFSCLVPETKILMRNGEEVQLKDIKTGDILFDSTVTSVENFTVNTLYIINSGLLKTSPGHINILSNGDLIPSQFLKVGDHLIDKDNNSVEITSITIENDRFEVINISTDTATYIANGIRTHNKLACSKGG